MTPKQYLMQLKVIECRIRARQAQMEELHVRVHNGIGSFDYSKPVVQTSATNGAGYERQVEQLMDLEREIAGLVHRYELDRHKVMGQISKVNNAVFEEILFKHYLEYKSLQEIADEMNYSLDWIKHSHGHALQAFEYANRGELIWN